MKRKISIVLVFAILISSFCAVNIGAANQSASNQKGYIKMPLSDVSDTDTKVEFKFNVLSSGPQKINVYAVEDNWQNPINWNTAPKNNLNSSGFDAELLGTVSVTGAKTYSLDVTSAVKKYKAKGLENITLALSGETSNGFTSDFSDISSVKGVTTTNNVSFGTQGEYVKGGDGAKSFACEISSAYDKDGDADGKSLHIAKEPATASVRYKFYNGLKSSGALTNDDLGRKFKVSFSVLNPVSSGMTTAMSVGFMSAAAGTTPSGTKTNAYSFKGNTYTVKLANTGVWTDYSFDFEITQDVIDWQAGMLTFSNSFKDLYIDNIKVADVSDMTVINDSSDDVYAPDFDLMETLPYYKNGGNTTSINIFDNDNEYAYRPGGAGGATLYLDNSANYPDTKAGKCLRVERNTATSTSTQRRLKFYNTIKKSALDSSDIGRQFKISAYAKLVPGAGSETVAIAAGMLSENNSGGKEYGTNTMYGAKQNATLNSSKWTKIEYTYTIDQTCVDYQIGMPSFVINSALDYYLDELNVTEVTSDASKMTQPRFVITKSDATEKAVAATETAYVADGENEYTQMPQGKIIINDKGYERNDLQTLLSSWQGTFEAGQNYGYKKILRNNTKNDIRVLLFTALYNDKGLADVNVDSKTLSAGEKDTYETNIALPDNLTDEYHLKTYMWDGDNMAPLSAVSEYPMYYSEDDVIVKVKAPQTGGYSSFDVYVKGSKRSSSMYTLYKFQYINNPNTVTDFTSGDDVRQNAELYRVKTAWKAERTGEYSFTQGAQLLQEGEIEMAIREAANAATGGKSPGDFIGGFHGDEHFSKVTLTIDGKEVPLNKEANYTGKEIRFVQNSIVNRCNTPGDNLIEHMKDYKVTKNGIDLHQTAKWLQSTKINIAYLTMFTIMRESQNERITDYVHFFYNDGTEAAAPYDVSNLGVENYINTIEGTDQVAGKPFASYAYSTEKLYSDSETGKYVNKAHLWSKAGDIEAWCTTNTVQGLSNSYTQLQARIYGDNKCYFGSHEGMNVSAGDVWEVNNNYNIKIKN